MSNSVTSNDYGDARERLEQIAEAVANDDLPLDQALDLFEEAVALGMQIGDLLETGLEDALDPDDSSEHDAAIASITGSTSNDQSE